MCPNLFLSERRWWLYVTFDSLLPHRVSSVHENDRLSSVAAELQFKSLSRHSSPTEDREGALALLGFVQSVILIKHIL